MLKSGKEKRNKKKKFPDFYDVLGILSDNPKSQEEIEKMRTWSKPELINSKTQLNSTI